MWPCALIDNSNIKHDNIKHQSGNRFPTLQLDLKVPVKHCKQNSMYKKGMPDAFHGRSFSRTYTDPRHRFSQEIQNHCFPGSTSKLLNLLDPSWLCRILPIIKAVPFSHSSDLIHSLSFFSYLALLAFPDLRKKFSLEWRTEEPQICKASHQWVHKPAASEPGSAHTVLFLLQWLYSMVRQTVLDPFLTRQWYSEETPVHTY